ncbi:hypothetical protein [Dyella sp. C9]|uniref:hypothetical protein n=1 Tax=Dyella sp. C9 TaxID=2202154 RepID=UPI001300A531|nr:hypothetical protein [Dyella sp. C9]
MSLAINATAAVGIAAQTTSLGSAALNSSTSTINATNVTVQQAAPAAQSASLASALKSLGMVAGLAGDLQKVAAALVPSMQTTIQDRPDLATASFDFQSDHGAIKVVSSSLGDSDKAWLEKTLNANQGLVDAVQVFHDDATTSYGLWADAGGQSLSPSDTDKVSALADHSFSFMSMFQGASEAMLQSVDPHASYVTSHGAPINFHQGVNSALSFLVFQKSNQAVLDGTNTSTNGSHVSHGALKGNLFSGGGIPSFLPSLSSHSVGLSATA